MNLNSVSEGKKEKQLFFDPPRNYVRFAHIEDNFGPNEMRVVYPYQPNYSRWNNNSNFMKQRQELNYREPFQYNREQRPSGSQNYQSDQYYS